jgi:hypothetical protein
MNPSPHRRSNSSRTASEYIDTDLGQSRTPRVVVAALQLLDWLKANPAQARQRREAVWVVDRNGQAVEDLVLHSARLGVGMPRPLSRRTALTPYDLGGGPR